MTVAMDGVFRPRSRASFPGAVRSELLKVRGHRLTWVLLALAAIATAAALVQTLISDHALFDTRPAAFLSGYLTVAQTTFQVTSGILLLTGSAWLVGVEYAAGTVRIAVAGGTARLQLLGAQLVALAICGLLLLVGFVVIASLALVIAELAWQGRLSVPASLLSDPAIGLLGALLSVGSCILLGTAAAAVGRSLPFAMGVSLAFFPADNFGTRVMTLFVRVTHQSFWLRFTGWFLGPSLNVLPKTVSGGRVTTLLSPPQVAVTSSHVALVIGGWCALFALAAVLPTWRRDVLE